MPNLRRLLLLTIALLLLPILQSGVAAQEPVPPDVLPMLPSYEIAHPRVGIVNVFSGGAENFLRLPTDSAQPIVSVPAGRTFRLSARYEAVMHSLTAGFATFVAQAYLVDDGTEQFLAEDKATVANFGPRINRGVLNLDLRFEDPGTYHVLIRTTTRVKPVGVNETTTDEDEMTVVVEVGNPIDQAAGADPAPALLGLSAGPAQAQPPMQTQPTATRTVQVALPRGHIIDARNAAVNNFEQSSRTKIVLRRGDSLRFRAGPHEFVWFDGAAGSAEASLEILDAVTDVDPPISFGSDSVAYRQVEGPARKHDSLEVDVTFDEPGVYNLIARVRSVARPAPATDVQGVVDEDDVPVHVVVVETPETGSIEGTVTAADTLLPLSGVVVSAYAEDGGRPAATTRTQDDGTYRFDELKPGKYLIQAAPDRQNYLPEWYDDQPTKREADRVEVVAGETTDGIDFDLLPGASISGFVTEDASPTGEAAPRPLGGILIQVGIFHDNTSTRADILIGQTRTLEDGHYVVDQLPAGTVWVRAIDPKGLHKTEYWDDAETMSEATPIELDTGELMEDVDFGLAMAGGGTISGRVTQPGNVTDPAIGRPLPGILVTAVHAESGERAGKAETGPGGTYRMTELPAGRYLVHAQDPNGRFQDEWYDDKRSQAQADPVGVQDGQITQGIDFVLAPVAHVPTRLWIDPPSTSVRQVGDAFEVALIIERVEDLANFEVTLRYDPAIVHVDGAELGAFLHDLSQVGREYQLLDPIIDNEAGQARFGVFSVGTGPGVTGSGEVLHISLTAQGQGDTVLHQQDVQVLNTAAETIETRTEDGRVHVGECMAYDFDCDCDVDIIDVSQVTSRWGTEEGDPRYDPAFDLDNDGDIDIMDVAIIGAAWGTTCDDQPAAAAGGAARTAAQATTMGLQGIRPLGTTVRAEAPSDTTNVGGTAAVNVHISEAVDLKSFEFTLTFNPSVVRFETAELGDFMAGAFALEPIIDNEKGTVRFGASYLGSSSGVNGDGLLATLNFRGTRAGTSALEFTAVQLVNSFNQEQTDVITAGGSLVIDGLARYLPVIRR